MLCKLYCRSTPPALTSFSKKGPHSLWVPVLSPISLSKLVTHPHATQPIIENLGSAHTSNALHASTSSPGRSTHCELPAATIFVGPVSYSLSRPARGMNPYFPSGVATGISRTTPFFLSFLQTYKYSFARSASSQAYQPSIAYTVQILPAPRFLALLKVPRER